jgi:hypothetical protein
MRRLFGQILILTFLTSCSESFNIVDPITFNDKIATRTDIKSPEELIKTYYNYPVNEENPKFTINTKYLDDKSVEITLIHEGLEDDSQSGEKIVMTAKQTGQTWIVLEIKKNWKCWKGRGHTSWGTTLCN